MYSLSQSTTYEKYFALNEAGEKIFTIFSRHRVGIITGRVIRDAIAMLSFVQDGSCRDTDVSRQNTVQVASVFDDLKYLEYCFVSDAIRLIYSQEFADIKLWLQHQASMLRIDEIEAFIKAHYMVTDLFDSMGGYSVQCDYQSIINALGINEKYMKLRCVNLCAEMKRRIRLASVLLRRPQIYILDDPAEYLDETQLSWLKIFLNNSAKTCVLFSANIHSAAQLCDSIYQLGN